MILPHGGNPRFESCLLSLIVSGGRALRPLSLGGRGGRG
jgi:hypothetical protein